MRVRGVVIGCLLLGMVLAGCIGDGEGPEPGPGLDAGEADGVQEGSDDASYTLANSMTWDHHELDILLVPPAHGPIASTEEGVLPYGLEGAGPMGMYLQATLHVMEDWRWAIDRVAENHSELAWVADLVWNIRIVGQDMLTPEDVENADIVKFYYDWSFTPKGAAVPVPLSQGPGCVTFSTLWNIVGFQDGWNDPGPGYGSFTYLDMYMLSGHELLHCFGMSHPHEMEPLEDIMSYEAWPIPELRCPSNLNVWATASAFAAAFEDTGGLEPGQNVAVAHSDYEQYCSPHSDPRG